LELGTLLKEARMEKGLTLDDIKEQTKIRKKYLEAIENNNFDIIPGNVYVKVFIKGYARQVGLDYSSLIEEYEILKENSEADTSFNKDLLPDGKFKYQPFHNKKKSKFLKIIIIIFISLFAAATAFFIYQYFFLSDSINNVVNNMSNSSQYTVSESNDSTNNISEEETISPSAAEESSLNELNIVDPQKIPEESEESTDPDGKNSTNTEDSVENSENETLLTDQKTVSKTEETAVNEETAVSSTDNTNQLNLEEQQTTDSEITDKTLELPVIIKASDLAWVRVDVDGENIFRGLLKEGDKRKFFPNDNLYIKIGNGAAVTAEVEGTDYGPWGGSGEIAEAEIKIKDGEITVDNLRD